MKVIDIEKSDRKKIYEWFSSFDDTTYGVCVSMNVTKLVKLCKSRQESFFINFLYIIVNGLNGVEELRIRLVDNQVILYETINPSYTVMKKMVFMIMLVKYIIMIIKVFTMMPKEI